jgi:hypothetical protein
VNEYDVPLPDIPPTGVGLWERTEQLLKAFHPKLLRVLAEAATTREGRVWGDELVKSLYPDQWSVQHALGVWMSLTTEAGYMMTDPRTDRAIAAAWDRIIEWESAQEDSR